MSLNCQQREAVQAPGNAAVTAGAGTGKTFMLTARYLHHLRSDQLSPLQLVAVTFTDKAAAELRARIRQEVIKTYGAQSEIGAKFEAAPIGTIHSLAARICREHHEQAGIPPDFQILDEVEGQVWLFERLDDQLALLPTDFFDTIPFSLMEDVLETFVKDPLSMQSALKHDPLETLRRLEGIAKQARRDLIQHPQWQEAKRTLLAVQGAANDNFEILRNTAACAIQQFENDIEAVETLETITKISLHSGSKTNWPPGALDAAHEAVKSLKALIKHYEKETLLYGAPSHVDERLIAGIPILRQAVEQVQRNLEAQKRKERVLDFADLEIYALRALEDESVRRHYAKRWKAFLIDEFQDTNPVQARLIQALTGGAKISIVGDVKQSIYGFRRADVEVFRRFRHGIQAAGGKTVALSQSFRTHQPLVESVNRIFEPLLQDDHQNLTSERPAPHPAPHISGVYIDADSGIKKSPRQQAEAKWLARTIQQLLNEGLPIYDDDTHQTRPIQLKDIAILSRTWEPLESYAETLQAAELPAVLAAGGSLLETREAKDGLALLQFLADTDDNLALAAVLRSPFFALSDSVLYVFVREVYLPALEQKREQYRIKSLAWWPLLRQAQDERLGEAQQVLRELLAKRTAAAPSELLQLADRLTGYSAVIGNLPMPERRMADWRGLLQWCREMEAGPGHVFHLMRRVRKLRRHEVELERPPLRTGNAVSLMTIHAAKGLEWPVVFLPDLNRKSGHKSQPVYADPDWGCALRFPDEAENAPQALLFQHLAKRAKQRDRAESSRLLYVGFTRARDRVFLSARGNTGGLLEILTPGLHNATIALESLPYTAQDGLPLTPPMPEAPDIPARQILKSMGHGLREIYATDLADYAHCPYRFYLKVFTSHQGVYTAQAKAGREDAARLGTLTHLALEHGIAQQDDLARFDPRADHATLQLALQMAGNFREAPCFAQFQNGAAEHEVPIICEAFSGISIRGIIDLLGEDYVLDYKTSQNLDVNDYKYQIAVYAIAAKRPNAYIAGLRESECHSFTNEQIREMEAEIEPIVQGIQEEAFEATPSPQACAACPYNHRFICQYRYRDTQKSSA